MPLCWVFWKSLSLWFCLAYLVRKAAKPLDTLSLLWQIAIRLCEEEGGILSWTSWHVYVHSSTRDIFILCQLLWQFHKSQIKIFSRCAKKNQFSESTVAKGTRGELTALPQQLLKRLNRRLSEMVSADLYWLLGRGAEGFSSPHPTPAGDGEGGW